MTSNTVTFLFTDIEGSTRLWQEHTETMPETLARHDALVRDAIEGRGGRLFKHTGDGVCAAFGEAAAAVDAAIALQRALADAAWGEGPQPHVRVALDSGPAHERDADYFGPTLNRTARVLAVGSGDQIVATAATIDLARTAERIDLGLHRLRDLGEPVRLYQVVAPGLARAFAPLRTLERFRHSLPVVRSSFVGREAEIARLRELLTTGRLVTVTGVGGCGKTRLALAAAAHELERFPDGVYFVDLSIVTEPALVWPAIAQVLGATESGPGAGLSPRELVLGQLASATALMLLDNCEHLLDASADTAGVLVDRCAAVAVVTTSREPLGVEGEHVLRVPSLQLPATDGDPSGSEAVRLFAERAAAADGGFALTPRIAPIVADICRRLDGIPLAIELAAARVRHLSVEDIARRLGDRFRLLTGGPRGARQRQQTLSAALDWSHQLLSERERILLRRCAVFVDGFTLAGAEGVCVGDGLSPAEVIDVLGALVDKSLVSLHATEHRYRLLETIRLYAEERLIEAGEAAAVRSRHAAWFQQACDVMPHSIAAPRRIEDRENLKAARVWAHEMHDGIRVARLTRALFWQSGPYDSATLEERAWCDTLLAYDDLPPDVRAETLAIASLRDIGAGDWVGAIARARSALALAREPGEGVLGATHVALAIGLMVSDPDAAEQAIDAGIEHVRGARAPAFPEVFLASFKVGTALMRGDAQTAVERGRRSAEELGPLRNLGLGFALHLVGDQDGAEAEAAQFGLHAEQGVFGAAFAEYSRWLLLALVAGARGRRDDARHALALAAEHVKRHPYPLTVNDCVIVCGALAAMEGRLERSATLLAAVADRSSVRTPEMWAVYLHYRKRIRTRLDAATIRRCREQAQIVEFDRLLKEELAPDA